MNTAELIPLLLDGNPRALARAITYIENEDPRALEILRAVYPKTTPVPIIGITGPAGVGKSSLTDQFIAAYRSQKLKVGVVAVDPSSSFTGGAILGDRIRMQRHGTDPDVFIRSMATRGKLGGIAAATFDVIDLMTAAGKDIILIETVGVGQDEVDIVKIAHTTLVVLMPGLGDEVQAMKAGLMEIADILVINKSDRADAEKMESELQNVLSFFQAPSAHIDAHHADAAHSSHPAAGAQLQGWRPRILKTVAINNTGVDAVLATIQEHSDYLKQSGRLTEKLKLQSRQRLIDALEYQVTSRIIEEGFEKFGISQKIADIAERRIDPRSAVADLLSHFKTES